MDIDTPNTDADASAVVSGMVLGGRYRLLERVGSGGMATVWAARDKVLGREVAVKVAVWGHRPATARRLLREARTAARLSHHDIVDIYDYGETPSGDGATRIPYIVMELLSGRTLYERLRAGRPEAPEAAAICIRVAEAVAAAHAAGVAHRDLTLRNVMLTTEGVRVLDFGIAFTSAHHGALAPEVPAGRPASRPADVYALGILLDTVLAPVDPWCSELVEACTAEKPEDRPRAAEVARRLRLRHPGAETWIWPADLRHGRPRDPNPVLPAEEPRAPEPPARAAPRSRSPRPIARTAAGAGAALLFLMFNGAVPGPREEAEEPLPPWAAEPPSTETGEEDHGVSRIAAATDQLALPAGQEPAPSAEEPAEPEGFPGSGALEEAMAVLEEGASNGEIRADVAQDLRQSIENIRRNGRAGGESTPAEVAALRDKVEQRVEEGALSPGYAEGILTALERVGG